MSRPDQVAANAQAAEHRLPDATLASIDEVLTDNPTPSGLSAPTPAPAAALLTGAAAAMVTG